MSKDRKIIGGPDLDAKYCAKLVWLVWKDGDEGESCEEKPFSRTVQTYHGLPYVDLAMCQKSLADTMTGWAFGALKMAGRPIPQMPEDRG